MKVIGIDLLEVAAKILKRQPAELCQVGGQIRISKETNLYRFNLMGRIESLQGDLLHIFVDGGGAYTAITNPDCIHAVKLKGNLADVAEAVHVM